MSLTVINQAQQLAGAITSGTVLLPQGGATINVGAIMNPSDVSTPGNTVTLKILWSFDALTFSQAASCTWVSGPAIGPFTNVAPALTTQVPNGVLAYQAQLSLPAPLNIGANMTILNGIGVALPISLQVTL
jgi:hypothetical protein